MLLMSLTCCLMNWTCCVEDFEKLSTDFEMLFKDLSYSSTNFESAKNYKGGGGRRLPPPFVAFSATQNCSYWRLNH